MKTPAGKAILLHDITGDWSTTSYFEAAFPLAKRGLADVVLLGGVGLGGIRILIPNGGPVAGLRHPRWRSTNTEPLAGATRNTPSSPASASWPAINVSSSRLPIPTSTVG